MRLTILGSGTCLPVANHSAAGYLVRVGDTPLLVDAGPGTIARLAAAGVSYRDLEYVLLTHLHADHTLDLATLLEALVATPGWTREKTLNLIGCHGFGEFLQRLIETFEGIAPRGYRLDVTEMGQERRELPSWAVETALTAHTENSVAFRIEANGCALVLSGDAVETRDLVRLARNADVFICECSLPNGWPPTNHLMAGAVGRISRQANVKRLILTHLYPPALDADVVSQVREEFDGDVRIAVDGMEIDL